MYKFYINIFIKIHIFIKYFFKITIALKLEKIF